MMAPHWLDEVFENVRDPDELLQTLINSPEMQEIAKKVVKVGEEQRKVLERNPNICGGDPAQSMRAEFLNRLNVESREEALA